LSEKSEQPKRALSHLVGATFDGKFHIVERIARGGMGVVFKGEDRSLGREVAIKVLLQRFNTDPESVARFKREARSMASLDHPNIVPVYAIGQERDLHYFVMKFLPGFTVADRLKRIRLNLAEPFGVEETRQLLMQGCKALGHAHKKGLIHRDVKPSNIMISDEGHVTIMDFGIVKATEDETLTKTGIVFGTPDYMAPEHAQGKPPSAATDVYSLGIVAYEMVSGEQPFRGSTPFSIVLKHVKDPPAPLIERRDDIDPDFQNVIFKALAKDPSHRYFDGDEMLLALEALAQTPSVSAPLSQQPSAIESRPSLPTNRPSVRSVSAPAVPPIRVESLSDEVALVDDRPGHYRRMVTASGRQQKVRNKNRARMAFLVSLSIGVLIAGFLATYLVRKNKEEAIIKPVVEEVYRIEGDLKLQGLEADSDDP